jgi:hypothetical protein
MTLRELRAAHPDRFYPQTWYEGEAFLDAPLPPEAPTTVPGVFTIVPTEGMRLPLAVELAALYLRFPDHPVWRRYLWCADHDAHGQRVYVGDNGRGFEIHRHLHLTSRWGVPTWP